MPEYFTKRLPLIVVLIIFIACKIPHLHYAYYWDECWPYAVAIKHMYHHGISLMPTAIDAELSRGHPLFFHAMAAAWINIFGGSHVSLHSFALFISVLFLVAIYESGLRLFDKRTAMLALLMVATLEMFFVQSSMVLFDMLVAFLCFLSLVLYAKEKYFLTAVCLAMVFYTKESGLIVGFALGIDALIRLFNGKASWRKRLLPLATVAVPCVLIAIFFLMQKHIRGWYVFPLYSGLVPHKWDTFWYGLRINCIGTEFSDSMRSWYFMPLILMSVVAAIKLRSFRFLAVILPAVCIYYFVDDTRAGRLLPGVPFFIVFILSAFYYLYLCSRSYPQLYQRKLILLSGFFILCFLCFSAMNFFTPRYMLVAIVPMFFITAAAVCTLVSQTYSWLYYPIVICLLAISTYSFVQNGNYGDCDHGSYSALEVQQEVVDYFEKNVPFDQNISGLFLETQHLSDPAAGFLHTDKAFKNVKKEIDINTTYAVFDNIEFDTSYNSKKNDPSLQLVHKIEKGKMWGEIYKRK